MSVETIYALATPPGVAGVAVVRVSGPDALRLAKEITQARKDFRARYAHCVRFYDQSDHTVIDSGLLLYFPAPHSFTGDAVVELHCHGSMIVVDRLGEQLSRGGARQALPGEFSERSYLNNKHSLFDLEMICDLIHAKTKAAQKAAIQSLQGCFKREVTSVYERVIAFRVQVEAAIDFVEEAVDFIARSRISPELKVIQDEMQQLIASATKAVSYREGVTVMLLGPENVGKSTLHNYLCQAQKSIVTDIPGTTRQMHDHQVSIAGLPCELIDTPGLRETKDPIENIGINQVKSHVETAQVVVFVLDLTRHNVDCVQGVWEEYFPKKEMPDRTLVVMNKLDQLDGHDRDKWVQYASDHPGFVCLSMLTGDRVDSLERALSQLVHGGGVADSPFLARSRHVDALLTAQSRITEAMQQLAMGTYELVAEELKLAQEAFELILGRTGNEQLLTQIFRTFCLGK